ncbi:hypothetical protein GA0070607_5587 [Micromonospora coriariae]|uniref:Uncharacterized protein n=1 Tax=Micromonospora coriariae TaxID=285665 RepID=A0A1C4XPR6_9ACTN|nr:hypothetical protein [Micromonospora coriariae]SCF10485.1 hypothetical protein GA0070607_5587 [Micromonospora coriariae]
MLSSFLQTMATRMVEEILKRLVEWLAPKALRSVPHRAAPNCPRCGGYGVARWAPGGVRAVFVLSLLAFTWGFAGVLLGVPAVVLAVVGGILSDGLGAMLPALLVLLGLPVSATVMIAGALGLAYYQSYPPKRCNRCRGSWPRRERDEYLRAARPVFTCGCGQRLRVPGPAGARLRCPRCGTEHATPAAAGR